MLRNKCILASLLILIVILNFVEAGNKNYIVSFVAGQTNLGFVAVSQADSEIQASRTSITRMDRIMGSTALLSFVGGWDGDVYFNVLVINAGTAANPLQVSGFEFNSKLNHIYNFAVTSQVPGQYHPLQIFEDETNTRLLTAGTFGTSGANNYVSNALYGSTKSRIFVNPEDRSSGTAAVAPDGGLVSQMTFKGLNHIGLIGRLVNGKLEGSPYKWLNVNDYQGYSQSLSNPVQATNGTRYLAYRNFRQPGTSQSQSKLLIQNVDAKTGRLKGSPRSITKFASAMNVDAEKLQSIVISPDGELILYTAWNNDCNKQILIARRLTNGSSVGEPKVIVGCGQLQNYPVGVYGINITSDLRSQ